MIFTRPEDFHDRQCMWEWMFTVYFVHTALINSVNVNTLKSTGYQTLIGY